jgi:hypothetical protein
MWTSDVPVPHVVLLNPASELVGRPIPGSWVETLLLTFDTSVVGRKNEGETTGLLRVSYA